MSLAKHSSSLLEWWMKYQFLTLRRKNVRERAGKPSHIYVMRGTYRNSRVRHTRSRERKLSVETKPFPVTSAKEGG